MNKLLAIFFFILVCGSAYAQGPGTIPNHSVMLGRGPTTTGFGFVTTGITGLPLISNNAGNSDPTFQVLQIVGGGTGQSTRSAAINGLLPTPTRAGDVLYWNGSAWITLAGNNSGTLCLSENSSGVPQWVSCSTISGPGSSTNTAIVRWNGTGGSTIQDSSVLVDSTTGMLSKSGGGGVPIEASNTNAAACTTCVGYYVDAPLGGGVTAGTVVPTATTTTVNSLPSLPSGDWMIQCGVLVCPTAATLTGVTELHITLSDTSGALMGPPFGAPYAEHVALQDNQCQYRNTGTARWNNNSARTTYCVARMTYTGGSATVQSWMYAYRFH